MKLDIQSVHSSDIGEQVGEFYGTPILFWDEKASRLREGVDRKFRIEMASLTPPSVRVEENKIINREPIEVAKTKRVTIKEAQKLQSDGSLIIWRPNGEEFALEVL